MQVENTNAPCRVLILANHYQTVRIFRRDIMKEIVNRGCELFLSIPECAQDERAELESYGCRVVFTKMDRRGMNPAKDLTLIVRYGRLVSKLKPDKVITYTIKPNIYGAFVCRLRRIPCYVNITGLGSAFQSRNKTRTLVSMMYKIACKKVRVVFFENAGNQDTLLEDGILRPEQCAVLNGAGVNLEDFPETRYPDASAGVRFLFVGRIMKEKGVDELFEVIPRVKKLFPDAEFDFIGWYEDDYKDTIERLEGEGLIRYHGFVHDVKPFIERSHCIVLPSWHEGMSNTLLEGAAMCRPLITNRIHGCMEAVIEGESGFLAEKQDAQSLYEQIIRFASMPWDEKKVMGERGREYMKERFDKKKVVEETMKYLGL